MNRSWPARSAARLALLLLLPLIPATTAAAKPDRGGPRSGWLVVDYAELIDLRQPSHSGESIGALLERLEGRSLPPTGERPADRNAHVLLDSLLEPYAFVLSDALDSLGEDRGSPWVEVGSLWQSGDAQPAWVELLHARSYVVESDGTGSIRAILPWAHDPAEQGIPGVDSLEAAGQAWDRAWPVLRLVLAAERRRLSPDGEALPVLSVEVHAYRHLRELSLFQLGRPARKLTVDDTRPDGRRPPLDFEGLREFFESGLRLEGARLENGRLRLFGSHSAGPPELLRRRWSLADLAVAYRAVFHGGLSRPYMSLDRGYSPQTALVNYGGRLRDTSVGMVSLLCDIRFKTFSLGLDIATGEDLRDRLRERIPAFRTHLERMAADPGSGSVYTAGQQTRMWFYPDSVDLTLSEQGDVLVFRRVRMTAASERVGETGLSAAGEVPPWTRATVQAINQDYDALIEFFPELSDLDEVVRLLSLFAWLKQAQADGLLLPELESLLAVELPKLFTPRTYPQLLAFNALPPPGSPAPVTLFDRVRVAEALDRLNPPGGRPLPARRRYQRAVGALDPDVDSDAKLLAVFERYDAEQLKDDQLDLLAQRAERLRMHRTVISTLDLPRRRGVHERMQNGESLRIFSSAIGGLDLGMGSAVEKARARRLGLAAGEAAPAAGDATHEPREEWRRDPSGLPQTRLPDHGPDAPTTGQHRVVPGSGDARSILTLYGADGPEVRGRRAFLDSKGRASRFVRVEDGRVSGYRFDDEGNRMTARLTSPPPSEARPPESVGRELPAGLMLLHLATPGDGVLESPGVVVRLESWISGATRNFEAEFPRPLLQRLVLGRSVDLTPARPLGGLSPLPGPAGAVESVMVLPAAEFSRPPWEGSPPLLAGEEHPLRLARAFEEWWAGDGAEAPSAIVGTDRERSLERWATAPRPDSRSILWLPDGGPVAGNGGARGGIGGAWESKYVVRELPEELPGPLVVLISGEPPGAFSRRLRVLARDPRMRGRLLAAWCLSGPLRPDLPASLLEEGHLSGVGIAADSVVDQRDAVGAVRALRQALKSGGNPVRAEQLPGPFLWHF